MPPKVSLGIPFYGPQDAEWWAQTIHIVASFSKQGAEYAGLLTSGSMMTDNNRNLIVERFLQTDSEWLLWIDSDTILPDGGLARLLAMGKTLASGLYYGKHKPHPPIAYYREDDGTYRPISDRTRWEVGEILPVDAGGMGCLLSHRSVYEDIVKTHTPLQMIGGGIYLAHNDDLRGELDEKPHATDRKIINGQLRIRVKRPTLAKNTFPFFALQYGRTEDMPFYEAAARCGHKMWIDTSVECGHLRPAAYTGAEWRDEHGR